MLKFIEASRPESCWNRAQITEPVFVLLARDAAAPAAIRHWASTRIALGKNTAGDPQIKEALALADDMEQYAAKRATSGGR